MIWAIKAVERQTAAVDHTHVVHGPLMSRHVGLPSVDRAYSEPARGELFAEGRHGASIDVVYL